MKRAAITDTEGAKAQRLESAATRVVPRQYGDHGVYVDWRDRGLGSLGSGTEGLLGLPNELLGRIVDMSYVDPRPRGPRPPAVEVPIGMPYTQDTIYADWSSEIPPRDATQNFSWSHTLSYFIAYNESVSDQLLNTPGGGVQRALTRFYSEPSPPDGDKYEESFRNLQVI